MTGAERIEAKGKKQGQRAAGSQLTQGFALKEGGRGSLEGSEQRRGDLGFNRILLATVHEWTAEEQRQNQRPIRRQCHKSGQQQNGVAWIRVVGIRSCIWVTCEHVS